MAYSSGSTTTDETGRAVPTRSVVVLPVTSTVMQAGQLHHETSALTAVLGRTTVHADVVDRVAFEVEGELGESFGRDVRALDGRAEGLAPRCVGDGEIDLVADGIHLGERLVDGDRPES